MAGTPSTPALRVLRSAGVTFDVHAYRYEPRGGTRASAAALGVDEHAVVKTLVLCADGRPAPLLVLMHGDRDVSLKALARTAGVRAVERCSEAQARRATGYQFGGTSPFGTRQTLPIYLERSVLDLARVYINGGARGVLVSLDPEVIVRLLAPVLVDVAQPR